MNKRKKKKKNAYGSDCEEIWGYVMPYKELKRKERMYHEDVIVNHYYRNCDNTDEFEDLACACGESNKEKYIYPNRFRYKTLRRTEGKGFHKVL